MPIPIPMYKNSVCTFVLYFSISEFLGPSHYHLHLDHFDFVHVWSVHVPTSQILLYSNSSFFIPPQTPFIHFYSQLHHNHHPSHHHHPTSIVTITIGERSYKHPIVLSKYENDTPIYYWPRVATTICM